MMIQLNVLLLAVIISINAAYGTNSSALLPNTKIENDTIVVNSTKATTTTLVKANVSTAPITPSPDLTHRGRENVYTPEIKQTINKDMDLNYDVMSGKVDRKPVVPKKGADYYGNAASTTTTTKLIVPVTESSTLPTKSTEKSNNTHDKEVNVAKRPMEYMPTSSQYILPALIMVILLPFIGFLSVVFYKYGSEWWQHRHYRRMDFLIDGMYNN